MGLPVELLVVLVPLDAVEGVPLEIIVAPQRGGLAHLQQQGMVQLTINRVSSQATIVMS